MKVCLYSSRNSFSRLLYYLCFMFDLIFLIFCAVIWRNKDKYKENGVFLCTSDLSWQLAYTPA